LPNVDRESLERVLAYPTAMPDVSAFALGLFPMFTAALLVELAALCVPRWRALRTGGPDGRGRLVRASYQLGVVLASVQALGLAIYLERAHALEGTAGLSALSRLLIVFTLISSTCFLLVVSWFLDAKGFGGGFGVLFTAFAVVSMSPLVVAVRVRLATSSGDSNLGLTVGGALLLAVVGTVFVLRYRPAGSAIRLPACGVAPVGVTAGLLTSAATAIQGGIAPPLIQAIGLDESGRFLAVGLATSAPLAVAFGFLFNRPSKVAAFAPESARRVGSAVALSAIYVVALLVITHGVGRSLDTSVTVIPLVAATAVVLDVIAEATAVRRHGELVPVWPEHRLYAVDAALAALQLQGIPGVARSVHQRALWQFFAPLIPIQIMVPPDHADQAREVLRDHLKEDRP
jgi:hypothetical protein